MINSCKIKNKITSHSILRGENLDYKVVAMESSKRHIMSFLTSLAVIFGHVHSLNGSIRFYESQPYLVRHVTEK